MPPKESPGLKRLILQKAFLQIITASAQIKNWAGEGQLMESNPTLPKAPIKILNFRVFSAPSRIIMSGGRGNLGVGIVIPLNESGGRRSLGAAPSKPPHFIFLRDTEPAASALLFSFAITALVFITSGSHREIKSTRFYGVF